MKINVAFFKNPKILTFILFSKQEVEKAIDRKHSLCYFNERSV